jgi:23S rRNA (uracil1939-C5)-methyltransferase
MGELRYVWFKTNGKDVLVTLITSRDVTEELRTLAAQLVESGRARGVDVGVHVGVQNDTGNNMRAESVTLLKGAETLSLELAGVALELGPLGFLQPNPAVAALAYADLCRDAFGQPASGALALDVYAGAGATTHQLRTQFTQVLANDADHESARLLGVKPQDARDFLDDVFKQGAKPSLAVCNPPRGGMGNDVCEALIKLAPERIHIMSCNPESLARDLKQLSTRYTVEATRAYDTLPQTLHVEVVVWLVQARPTP